MQANVIPIHRTPAPEHRPGPVEETGSLRSLEAPEGLTWPLLAAQERIARALPGLEKFCEGAARVLGRPKLSGRPNTRRCYEQLFDPLCADTGVWPDYTEGHYPEGNEEYEDAQLKQFDFILDKLGCGDCARVLDIGCGNGNLMRRAKERGCDVSGITISRTQAKRCGEEGLDVRVCSFDKVKALFEEKTFDAIILNGSTEHFVNEEDVLSGRASAVRKNLFENLQALAKPGGQVFITCIHFRWPTDIEAALKSPLAHPVGSYNFYIAVLEGTYSGWYPEGDDYVAAADRAGLSLVFERDATKDYYLTSRQWSVRLQSYLKRNPWFAAKYLTKFFAHDPRYFFTSFLFWMYDPWTWQFRETEATPAPMIHRWLMFQSRAN